MSQSSKNHSRVLWIVRTGVLIALLIALQWTTSGTQAFAGQYITGTCVNCVLAVAALFGGVWSGAVVALLSPFFAFLLGIGPKLIQIVPCIALGNFVFVLALYLMIGKKKQPLWLQAIFLVIAACAKFLTLYILVVKLVIPVMGSALAEKQAVTFTAMFSWPQLVTALLGGTLALILLPLLKKAATRK